MNEELLDVLDENGNKTGEIETRKIVHEKGLWHRVAMVAVIDNKGKILMQKRATKLKTNPGKWDVTAVGHVTSGQDTIQTAIRELDEEVSIKVKEDELEYIFSYNQHSERENYIDNRFYDFYIVRKDVIDVNSLTIQESEVDEIKLCSYEEIREMERNGITMKREKVFNELEKYLK